MGDPVNRENPAATEYTVPPNTDAAKLQAGLLTTARDIGIILTFVTATLGFWEKHDLIGWIAFFQSEEAIPAVALLCGVGLGAWRFWKARRNVKITAIAAETMPGVIVKVKDS